MSDTKSFPFGEELQKLIAAAAAAGRPLPEIIFTLVITTLDLENRFIRATNAVSQPPQSKAPDLKIVLPTGRNGGQA